MNSENPKKKHWFEKAIIYQIYPLSFKDSNNDGYGDLKGIIEKIDYIKELGANAIWLSPFYESPMKDFGYDVSAYKKVGEVFGAFEDIERLISEIHQRDMKVIIDLILNHTSEEHHWFKEARSSKDNSKRDFYVWRSGREEAGQKKPPNNWLSVFGGSAWDYDEATDEWYLHSYLSSQPDLNWRNPELKKEMFKVIDFWLTLGIDGFRGDAIDNIYEDSEFTDEESNPNFRVGLDDPYNALIHSKTTGLPETIKLITEISEYIKKFGDIFFITEAYLDVNGLANVYNNCPVSNHSPFNFNFVSMPWQAKKYKEFIDKYIEISGDFPKNYVFGNHDRNRVTSRLGEKRALALALLSMFLPGSTFVYYGDEIGMINIDIKDGEELDEWSKNVPGMNLNRDKERGVMQWDNSEFAGFSFVKPWIGMPKKQEEINVVIEKNNPKSILNFYKKIIALKKEKIFTEGEYQPLPIFEENVLFFKRVLGDKSALIIINMSDKEISIPEQNNGSLAISSYRDNPDPQSPLRPNEARVLM